MAETLEQLVRAAGGRWLVTGVAGFIGSHLAETLLRWGQQVIGLDNFATGHRHNLDEIRSAVGAESWRRFQFVEGDIRDLNSCRSACAGVTAVLHQAALGSVPRSIDDPLLSTSVNVMGTLNMMVAARDAGVKRFVYASSSAVYGDHPDLPKVEERIGRSLSPYALTKLMNEEYAAQCALHYKLPSIGLRYFNVVGSRQDPAGAYAAVIPRWVDTLLSGQQCTLNGDGETSRDFCDIRNVVQANLRAALVADPAALGQAYNVAVGGRTSLNQLFQMIVAELTACGRKVNDAPIYGPFRSGDVRHSLADIGKARRLLGYEPEIGVEQGVRDVVRWFAARR